MDPLSKEQRRRNMQAIKSRDTSIEIILRKALWAQGIRYRKNYTKLIGKPDIAITKYRIAVFCDSEFWHGYNWEEKKKKIKNNASYWIRKIERNMERDFEVNATLYGLGWTVIRFWGKEIKKDTSKCVHIVIDEIEKVKHKEET